MRYFSTFILALLSILFFASCSVSPEGTSYRGGQTFGFGNDDDTSLMSSTVGAIGCVATPRKAQVSPGESFDVDIEIIDGAAPYSAPGYLSTSSSPTFTVTGRFNFTYGTTKSLESYIRVTATLDGVVETGYCPFTIVLLP